MSNFYEHCHTLGALPFYFIISQSNTVQQRISEVVTALVPEIFCANTSLKISMFYFLFSFCIFVPHKMHIIFQVYEAVI